jgi:hypothetical protein
MIHNLRMGITLKKQQSLHFWQFFCNLYIVMFPFSFSNSLSTDAQRECDSGERPEWLTCGREGLFCGNLNTALDPTPPRPQCGVDTQDRSGLEPPWPRAAAWHPLEHPNSIKWGQHYRIMHGTIMLLMSESLIVGSNCAVKRCLVRKRFLKAVLKCNLMLEIVFWK